MQADVATLDLTPSRPAWRPSNLLLFLIVSACALAIAWAYNTFVMTREVYHTLLGGQLDSARVDQLFDLLRSRTVYAHAMVPVVVLIRAGIVALLLQLVLLLTGMEAPLGRLFRAALMAFGVLLVESAARVSSLALMPADRIDQAVLSANPASLGYWLLSPGAPQALSIALSPFTLSEAVWLFILALAVRQLTNASGWRAIAAAVAVWFVVSLMQVTLALYFVKL